MKKIIICSLIFLFILSFCSTIFAQPSIKFIATNVYWVDVERLAVEGYFINNGTNIINGITFFELTIYYRSMANGNYYWLGRGIWQDNARLADVYLYPGDASYWTFYIDTEGYPAFNGWHYKWHAKYNFIK